VRPTLFDRWVRVKALNGIRARPARDPDGRVARLRRLGEDGSGWLRHAMRAAGVCQVLHSGNHRYAFRLVVQPRLVAIGLPSGAYPKERAA
jgi:hypothetical protein